MDTTNITDLVSVSPYDDSLYERNTMYDKMPYIWNTDLNVDKRFLKVTGNIIKSYRCQINEKPYELKSN